MEIFGRYRLLKQIAAGGMGEIFLARSISLDGFTKDLVIKRILPSLTADERFVSMFLDEARISMSLCHQNIVQVFDFGETEGRYYLAMEHVYGTDLKTVLRLPQFKQHGLPPGLALYIIGEVCKALDYAHNRRNRSGELQPLIHRDISPDNIMVSFDGAVKITDFGIAKTQGEPTMLPAGAILGKIAYISPERAEGGSSDARADLFSCGAVLWELLVGKKMYAQENQSDVELYRRVLSGQVDRPSIHNRDLNRRIDKLVMKAVAAKPDNRYSGARELGNEIHELLGRKYRDVDSYALQSFFRALKPELKVVGFEDLDTGAQASSEIAPLPAPLPAGEPSSSDVDESESASEQTVVSMPPEFDPDPELLEAAERFKSQPSLWEIVQMGNVCADGGRAAGALACYRVAAVKFAQRGLLAQSLLAAKLMLEHGSADTLDAEIGTLPSLAGRSDARILPYLFRSAGAVEEILGELLAMTHSPERAETKEPALLSHLGGSGFAALARLAPMRRYAADEQIVVQGEHGSAMYLLLAGRALVFVTKPSGERVYVAALVAGDFFGENGFFSGSPRSATVEALEPAALIEIDPNLYARVMSGNPWAANILDRFYMERIVDSILATSPAFGLLSPSERRALLDKFRPAAFDAGARIVTGGVAPSALYVVKSGEAAVCREEGAEREVVSVLGPGSIIGEEAIVTGAAPAASVIAMQRVESFRVSAGEIEAMIARAPRVAEHWRSLKS